MLLATSLLLRLLFRRPYAIHTKWNVFTVLCVTFVLMASANILNVTLFLVLSRSYYHSFIVLIADWPS